MTPSEDRAPVRSYQRIFRPERRIYQVEGHRIPVPGGVPLRWLGYATGTLLAVILLTSRSPALSLMLAAVTTAAAFALGGRATALAAGAGTFGAAQIVGYMLATIDWPMRLLVLPALAATLATQATPDGRSAHRYARSWVALQLRPERRTLGRPLPPAGERVAPSAGLRVAPDARGPRLRRARLHGPAVLTFTTPMHLRARRRVRRGRLARSRPWRGAEPAERVELAAGERLEVRP